MYILIYRPGRNSRSAANADTLIQGGFPCLHSPGVPSCSVQWQRRSPPATVIIENRPGASGSVGTAAVAKSPPDGNSWLIVFDNHAANPFVLGNLPYDTEKDLDPVLFIGTAPYAISTQSQKPFKTLGDVIAAAKAKPETVSYASVGSGSIGHLAMALLSKQAGIRLVHVPYRGGGPAMNDAIAGHVDLLVGSTALAIPQIQAGTVRALVQTGKTRTAALGE